MKEAANSGGLLLSILVGEVPATSAIRLCGRLFRPAGLCGSFRPAARQVEAIRLQLAGVLLLRKAVLQAIEPCLKRRRCMTQPRAYTGPNRMVQSSGSQFGSRHKTN